LNIIQQNFTQLSPAVAGHSSVTHFQVNLLRLIRNLLKYSFCVSYAVKLSSFEVKPQKERSNIYNWE